MRKSSVLAAPSETSMPSQRPSGDSITEVQAEGPSPSPKIIAVLGWVGAQTVKEDPALVLFLARRQRARRRIARVIETAARGQPGQRASPRPRNDVRPILARVDVAHAQGGYLAAARRDPVGQQAAVLRRVPPVERLRSVSGQSVHVEQDAIRSVRPLPHIKHGLVLLASVNKGVSNKAPKPLKTLSHTNKKSYSENAGAG